MSESSSESQGESSSSQQYTKGNKLMRKSKSLRLMPSDEELKYRNKNFKNVDLLADYADKLKCTKCNTNFKSDIEEGREVYSHPLLKVLMCKNCCSYYGNGDFSLDEDDEDKYCRWCGEGGTLFLCSKCICGFCPKCIKKHFGIEKRKEIENDDDWICFFCSPEMLYDLRAICAFAIEEANKNKKKLRNKRESKLMNLSKRVSTGSNKKRGGRRSVRNSSPASSSEKESKEAAPVEEVTLDDSSSPEDGGVFKTKQPKKSALKRKRTSNASAKAEAAATTSDGTESDNKKQTKRVRISPRKPKSSAKPSDKKNASDDSTSESDEETNENSKPLPKNLTKSIQKLKDFFKVTEMTAELCVNVCRKKLNKMDKKDFITTSEKLIKESQKLTTVVTLLTTNLTAVSQSVTSLQNKLGLDAKAINISSLFSDYTDNASNNLLALLLKGIEANQQQQSVPIQVQQQTQTINQSQKEELKKDELKTPTKAPTPKKSTPVKKTSPKKPSTLEKDETMEVDKPAEPETIPEESQMEVEKGEVLEVVEVVENPIEPEKPAEEVKENHVDDNDNKKEELELAADKSDGENTKVDDILAACDDMFEDAPVQKEKNVEKVEEKKVNGEKEDSPKKSEEISLEIFTQVEKSGELKSPVKDLERASTSNAIEGTVTDS